jgi:thiol-disulfide isomerase/thioredoxin
MRAGELMTRVGAVALLIALAVAVLIGVVRSIRAGRLRPAGSDGPGLTSRDLSAASLGDRATLVHFSSAFCRPCVAVRHVLHDVAERVPGVAAVEIDAESNLDLLRKLHITTTPTTLLLDSQGVERQRATGVPRRSDVLAALNDVVERR